MCARAGRGVGACALTLSEAGGLRVTSARRLPTLEFRKLPPGLLALSRESVTQQVRLTLGPFPSALTLIY